MSYSQIISIINMLASFIHLFNFPCVVFSAHSFGILPLPSPGPESFGFDLKGKGPYTGISDGRIVKYQGSQIGFVDYAYTSPNRSKALCDGTNNTDLIPTCGRPLGLKFYYATGELYATDSKQGLCVVGPNGGLATQLATTADGEPFRSPDGVEVDQGNGIVYFTDASAVYSFSQFQQIFATNDSSGRLLKYEPKTKQVTVLLRNLSASAGVAISDDSSFLLVTEGLASRIRKYWLKGPRVNTSQVLLNLRGRPNKIKRTVRGDFWVAVTVQTNETAAVLTGLRIDGSGTILESVTFSPEFNSTLITEVEEFADALYLGSLNVAYVGVYGRA